MLASPPRDRDEIVLPRPRLYIERVAIVPPVAAEAAFDLLLELGREGANDPHRYRFHTAAGDLVLLGPVRRPAHRASAVFPVRVLYGWVASRTGVYRMRVELELVRWSGRAAGLGLRPVGHRHHPLGFGAYLRIGCDAVTRFRDEIEVWAKTWTEARST